MMSMMRKEGSKVSLPLSLVICLLMALTLVAANGVYGTINAFSQEKPVASAVVSATLSTSWYVPPIRKKPYPLLPPSRVKNVILLIGDGMGLSQIAAARIKAVGAKGKLHLDRIPVTGLITTCSAGSLVTDSAAAATALATGRKTNNGMIGVDPQGKRLPTILEAAKDRGMATGLVVTSTITHATPGPFAAHVKSRYDEVTIATQLLNTKVNVLLGGGKAFFLPRSAPGSKRKDDRDLIGEAREKGYLVVQTKEELEKAEAKYVLGLFQLRGLTTKPPEPSLAEMTGKAIRLLSRSDKGFFLMVEGSQIDWASHRNDINDAIKQTLLFDEAVKAVLDFALADKRTLVVVTADHETGGLVVRGGSLQGNNLTVTWTTNGHTPPPVPLSAFGPGAEAFMGLHDNTDVPKILAKSLGLIPFPPIREKK